MTAGYIAVAGAGPGTGPAGGDGAQASPVGGDGAQASPAVALTPAGQQAAGRLAVAREAGIDRLVKEWQPDKMPELRLLIGRITTTLVATDASPERDGVAAPTSVT